MADRTLKKNSSMTAITTLVKSVRLLAGIGGIALASTGECDRSFLLAFLAFFLLGIKIESLKTLPELLGRLQPVLAAMALGLGVIDFFYLSNSFLLAVAHFLLCLQGIRLLALRTNRENLGSVLLSSMMILSASTLAVEWTFFVVLFLFLPALIWTLIIHNISSEWLSSLNEERNDLSRLETPSVTSGQTDFGEGGSLSALQFERTPGWRTTRPVIRLFSAVAFLVTVVICAVVFMIFPRFNFRGFHGQFLQPVRTTGYAEQVNLEYGGEIFTNRSVVMRVEIAKADKDKWTGYLRAGALDVFDGRTWKKSGAGAERYFNTGRGEIYLPTKNKRSDVYLHQSIYLESTDSTALFAAPYPIMLKIDRPFVEVGADGSIHRGVNDTWRLHYEVDSFVEAPIKGGFLRPGVAGKLLQSYGLSAPIPAEIQKEYAGRIQSLRQKAREDDRVLALALSIVKDAANELEAAGLITTYLSRNYAYSTKLGRAPKNENPVERFLFVSKKGYCDFFATSFCVLLNRLGVPTRMVSGFQTREWNEHGFYFIARAKDAHAWAEAYIKPYGWVAFDPTPPTNDWASIRQDWKKKLEEAMDYFNLRWNRYILSYDMQRQADLVRSMTVRSSQVSSRLEKITRYFSSLYEKRGGFGLEDEAERSPTSRRLVPMVLSAIGASVLGFGLWIGFRRIRISKRDRIWFYKSLLRYMEKAAGPKPSGQTLDEFLASLRNKMGENGPHVEFLTREYYRLRYDPSASLKPKEAVKIAETLQKLK